MGMGFDSEMGRRALKLTGDLNTAVNMLISGANEALNGVSDSEDEEHQAKALSLKAEEEEKKAKQKATLELQKIEK